MFVNTLKTFSPYKWYAAFFRQEKITNRTDMLKYLNKEFSKLSGNLVMGYSQKALGKKHYVFTSDKKYASELVHNQIKIHFRLSKDLFPYIIERLNFETPKKKETFTQQYLAMHLDYVKTAPEAYRAEPILTKDDLNTQLLSISDVAMETGKYLYENLPMANKLYRSNIEIFYGQMKYTYINFLTKLDKLVKPGENRETVVQT